MLVGARRRLWGHTVLAVVVLSLASACSPFGSATVRVDDAQVELAALVEQIVGELGVSVSSESPFFLPQTCTRVTGQDGAFSAMSVSGGLSADTFRADAAAAILLAAGFELQRADGAVDVFGRRDGMWVTASFEPRRGLVTIDANTGCRAV
jgi:hypothetical protein